MSIYESSDYKKDLKGEVISIKRMLRKYGGGDSEKYYFKLEKFVFVSAYLIRKLIESKKLSDELENEVIECGYFQIVDPKGVDDHFNKHKIDKNYNLETRGEIEFKIYDLVSVLIHSYIFLVDINDELLSEEDLYDNVNHFELFFTSTRRKNSLFSLKLPTFLILCKMVYSDEIRNAAYRRETEKGPLKVVRKSRDV